MGCTTPHANMIDADLHVPGYIQAVDPGAVGAGLCWIDTGGGAGHWAIKVRNVADLGWETVGVPDHGDLAGLGTGADHTFIDQYVVSGASPTFDGANFTGIPAGALPANLADIAALAVADGNFIVADGVNYITESGNTARTSLGLGTGDSPTFAGGTFNGAVIIDGSANEKQLIVQAHSTQTTHLLDAQDSAGNSLCVIGGTGRLGVGTGSPTYYAGWDGSLINIHSVAGISSLHLTNASGAVNFGLSSNVQFRTNLDLLFVTTAAKDISFWTNTTKRITIQSGGSLEFHANNIVFDTTTGTKIGTAANQKLGFYNVTPIIQPAGVVVSAAGIHAALVSLGLITA